MEQRSLQEKSDHELMEVACYFRQLLFMTALGFRKGDSDASN